LVAIDGLGKWLHRQRSKYGKLQGELLEWRNKCFESNSFCTPPEINAIDFNIVE